MSEHKRSIDEPVLQQAEIAPLGSGRRLLPRIAQEPAVQQDGTDIMPSASTAGLTTLHDVGYVPLVRKRASRGGLLATFCLMVVVPMAALLTYYLRYASPEYFSEFLFSVVEVSQSNGALTGGPGGGAGAAVAAAIGGASSVVSSSPQNYVVVDYLESPQVIDELSKKVDLRAIYSRPGIDVWNRLNPKADDEKLLDYWRSSIAVNYDPMTGLASAKVRAFTPQDALTIAQVLVTLSEDLVNRIANRTNEDAVRFAEGEVARSRDVLEQQRKELADFRDKEGVIDPSASVVSSNVQLYASITATLSQLETDYRSLLSQGVSPKSPSAVSLKSKIDSTRSELSSVESQVSASRQGKVVLARLVAQFESLQLSRTHAEALLLGALASLDRARANAASQHLYLTPYVRPHLPTQARGPAVARSMFIAGLVLFGAWLASVLIFRTVRIANA